MFRRNGGDSRSGRCVQVSMVCPNGDRPWSSRGGSDTLGPPRLSVPFSPLLTSLPSGCRDSSAAQRDTRPAPGREYRPSWTNVHGRDSVVTGRTGSWDPIPPPTSRIQTRSPVSSLRHSTQTSYVSFSDRRRGGTMYLFPFPLRGSITGPNPGPRVSTLYYTYVSLLLTLLRYR